MCLPGKLKTILNESLLWFLWYKRFKNKWDSKYGSIRCVDLKIIVNSSTQVTFIEQNLVSSYILEHIKKSFWLSNLFNFGCKKECSHHHYIRLKIIDSVFHVEPFIEVSKHTPNILSIRGLYTYILSSTDPIVNNLSFFRRGQNVLLNDFVLLGISLCLLWRRQGLVLFIKVFL